MRSLKNILLLSSIFIITAAFNFSDNPPSNWSQQFMPSTNGQPISDLVFVDSLNGFAITGDGTVGDTNCVLKTTNAGSNWFIVHKVYRNLSRIKFINVNTGFVSGGFNFSTPLLMKTTNAGINWQEITTVPPTLNFNGMEVLNADTMWIVDKNGFDGGIYKSTNGGLNWNLQFSAGSQNPTFIYFYDKKLGFAGNLTDRLYRTSNSGENWTLIKNVSCRDIHFVDSLTGWISTGQQDTSIQKTTNGGLNWVVQKTPWGGSPNILSGSMKEFSIINKDTLWGCGGFIFYPNGRVTGVLYHTTNGGTNWTYQVPDSSLDMGFYFIDFINKNNGWAFDFDSGGIHTNSGGDTTFLTNVKYTNSEIPKLFKLSQNYPNPFNPTTKINYQLRISNYVILKVYNLQGKEVTTLINQRQNAGSYSIEFDGSNLSSGIYFYTLTAKDFSDTKKMILIK